MAIRKALIRNGMSGSLHRYWSNPLSASDLQTLHQSGTATLSTLSGPATFAHHMVLALTAMSILVVVIIVVVVIVHICGLGSCRTQQEIG